jgi:hypothetical protein
MKHFGRSLLNPTLAAARRDFSISPLLETTASCPQPGFKDDGSSSDSVMRLAFRKARAAIGNPSGPAVVVARAGARRS